VGDEAAAPERSVRDRDERITALFDRHYVAMCRLAYVILGDAGAAEEVVMDALVKTYTGWGRLRDVERSEIYLKRAVVNGCRARIRRKVVESRAVQPSDRAPVWDIETAETRREVWDAVRSLPSRQRACIALRYYDDLTEAEIAHVLGIATGTVKSQLAKARASLARALPNDPRRSTS
jgi:RNA polymerase sigma-70 factor (sigma-E family)